MSYFPRRPWVAPELGYQPDLRIGALSAGGGALVKSVQEAEQQGLLSDEDGTAVYKAAKDTRGGQKQWWLEVGMGVGGGILLGYLLGKAF